MAEITVANSSIFCVGEAITVTSSKSTWPKWTKLLKPLLRYRWLRGLLDKHYPAQQITENFTITGITGSDTIAI